MQARKALAGKAGTWVRVHGRIDHHQLPYPATKEGGIYVHWVKLVIRDMFLCWHQNHSLRIAILAAVALVLTNEPKRGQLCAEIVLNGVQSSPQSRFGSYPYMAEPD